MNNDAIAPKPHYRLDTYKELFTREWKFFLGLACSMTLLLLFVGVMSKAEFERNNAPATQIDLADMAATAKHCPRIAPFVAALDAMGKPITQKDVREYRRLLPHACGAERVSFNANRQQGMTWRIQA